MIPQTKEGERVLRWPITKRGLDGKKYGEPEVQVVEVLVTAMSTFGFNGVSSAFYTKYCKYKYKGPKKLHTARV